MIFFYVCKSYYKYFFPAYVVVVFRSISRSCTKLAHLKVRQARHTRPHFFGRCTQHAKDAKELINLRVTRKQWTSEARKRSEEMK